MDDIYSKALDNARRELEGLMQERAQLDDRIAKLARSIESLAALGESQDVSDEVKTKLLDLEISEAMGMTEAIRHIIAASIYPTTATEIRDALVSEGFDPNKYANMLTMIHNTLQRLERQGEIHRAANVAGARGWQKTITLPSPDKPRRRTF